MSKDRIEINENDKSVVVRLRNARLSFPNLFKPQSFDGDESKAKYQATFLIKKDSEDAENMKKGVNALIKMAFEGKSPGSDRVCLRRGEEKDFDGYDDTVYFVSSNNPKKVPVVDRDLTPLDEEDGKPYAGCYVNATIRLWAQDNKYGKRVNANLKAVQFAGDGDPFGAGSVDAEDEFADTTSGSSSSPDSDEEDLF